MMQRFRCKHSLFTVFLSLAFPVTPLISAHADPYTLPDTGQTKCYNNSGEIPCPQPGEPFHGQDGNYQGPQVAYQLSAAGLVVTDLNTGLMWQQADDGVARDWDNAIAYCEDLNLDGYSDWRQPSLMDLVSIVNYGGPAIQPVISARSDWYWSGSTSASYPDYAWRVLFYQGHVIDDHKTDTGYVRCVRGGTLQFGPFVDNGDGTITDTSTDLTWQRADDGQTRIWREALSYCENIELAG
jgi:hypothetical protein